MVGESERSLKGSWRRAIVTQRFEPFLSQLGKEIEGVVTQEERERIIEESSAHLEALYARFVADNIDGETAVQLAIMEFGPPRELAADFQEQSRGGLADIAGRAYLACQLGVVGTCLVLVASWFPLTGGGSVVKYLCSILTMSFVLLSIGFLLFAERPPVKRVLAGWAALWILSGLILTPRYVPHPLGGGLEVSQANATLATLKGLGKGIGEGAGKASGRAVARYTLDGRRWESNQSEFCTTTSEPGTLAWRDLRASEDELRARGTVTDEMLQGALRANWVQRFTAALWSWAPVMSQFMFGLTALQAFAWLCGALVRWDRRRMKRAAVQN